MTQITPKAIDDALDEIIQCRKRIERRADSFALLDMGKREMKPCEYDALLEGLAIGLWLAMRLR